MLCRAIPANLCLMVGLLLILTWAAFVAADAPRAETQTADWPVFRGNPQSTGTAGGPLPAKLDVLWQFKPEGKNRSFDATPVICGGVVFIADLGNFDGRVYAIDAASGLKKWQFETDSDFIAAAAVRGDRVYVGDIDGRFYCLDAATGKEVWKHASNAEIDSGANFFGDKVLFGSQDATLYCLNAADGELVWKYEADDQIRCTPTVIGSRAFVAGCDGRLHIVDLNTGKAAAHVDIHAPTGVTPAAREDRVFFGTEGSEFLCIDWKQAKVVWSFEDSSRGQPLRSPPAIVDGYVVFGGQTKRVYALDPADGSLRWKFVTRQKVDAGVVIAGSHVFAAAVDGRLYALDLQTGKELWQYEALGGFVGSPAIAHGRLVIASDEGVVYCFGDVKKKIFHE